METKRYKVFVKVVEEASLTKAAEGMGLTQSGVSHIISAIEEELGLTLLTRSRTGAYLTPEGEGVLPHIRALLDKETELRRTAEKLSKVISGTIRIATYTSVATHWLPAIIKEFQEEYPEVKIKLLNGDYHDVDRWLLDGSVDLGFIALPSELKCECIALKEDRLMAVLPKGHPLAASPVCRVEDMARLPFISLLESSDNDARRALAAAGVKLSVKFDTKDDYAVIAMVAQGLGVSIMPELLLRGHQQGVEVRPLDPPSHRTVALALPRSENTGPAPRRFADFTAAWVQRNG